MKRVMLIDDQRGKRNHGNGCCCNSAEKRGMGTHYDGEQHLPFPLVECPNCLHSPRSSVKLPKFEVLGVSCPPKHPRVPKKQILELHYTKG